MSVLIKSAYIVFLLTLVLCINERCSAQSPMINDAGLWQNFTIEKKIFRRTSITNNEEARFDQNISHFNYIYTDIGIKYKATKWLHLSVDYVPILKNQDVFLSKRHQFYIDGTFVYKWKQFNFHNRAMFQWQYNDINSSENGRIPSWYYRNKIMIKYSYYNFEPFIASEIFYHFANPQGNGFTRNRSFAGITYLLDQRSSVELYYAIEQNFNSGAPLNRYIMGIGYNMNF